jgi:hypothetical protein
MNNNLLYWGNFTYSRRDARTYEREVEQLIN